MGVIVVVGNRLPCLCCASWRKSLTTLDLSIHVFLMKQGLPRKLRIRTTDPPRRLSADDTDFPIIHWNLLICLVSVTFVWLATHAPFTQYDTQFAILLGKFSSVTYACTCVALQSITSARAIRVHMHKKGNDLRTENIVPGCQDCRLLTSPHGHYVGVVLEWCCAHVLIGLRPLK